MQLSIRSFRRPGAAARPLAPVLFALAAACSDASGPDTDLREAELRLGPSLIECPTSTTASNTSLITPLLGGTVAVGNTAIVVPVGAVLSPVDIRVTVPASRFVEAEIVAGEAEHYLFSKTVVVTLDYSRCERDDIRLRPLTAWHIDPVTKRLLEPMGGVDDKLLRRVTFLTDHLSGYAIAF